MAAPKGNKFALGLENSGRPPIYSDPENITKKISEYFESNPSHITITGLCLFLGFESRQSFYAYEKKEEFSYIIKRARMVIESVYEEGLHGKTPAGSIFALKNMDWHDKSETELSGIPQQINVNVLSKENAEKLKKLMNDK